ncbi:TPA: DUF1472 domain-containing protein, partial [Klebsiella pneumoniae]|nr:DUF1472 domain-containing protein [Klebsiella pneumoniae]
MQGCADAAILARSQFFYDARRSSRRFLAQVSLENRPDQLRAISALRPPVSPLHLPLFAGLSCRHGTTRCRSLCDYGGLSMQYVNTCPVLNVEESDRLSFMPYLFGTDFMLAELQVYALAKKWMPEYEGGFWHFIRLPEGGGYMMPDCGRVHLASSENWFDRTV